MQVVETFDLDASPSAVSFYAKGAFDLLVSALSGEGGWEMTVAVSAVGARLDEREPNDAPSQAQALGELVAGDAIAFRGAVSAASDPADGVLVACPEAVRVFASVSMPAFQDFDLDLLDATADVAAPSALATFSAGANPEAGFVDVAAGTLLLARVRAASGAGAYDLSLSAAAPPAPPGTIVLAATVSRPSRPAPLSPLAALDRPWALPVDPIVPGEVLVRWKPGRGVGAIDRLRRRGGRVAEEGSDGVRRLAFDLPVGADEVEASRFTLSRLRGLPSDDVEYAEPNRVRHAAATPDDTYWNLQWNLRMIHAPEAWDVTTGADAVIVAVIDTGRTNHPDLAGRQSGGYDFISSASRARDGGGRDPDPTDPGDLGGGNGTSSFHGTHVAGIVGAATDNATGVAGVTWQTQIMHLRVLGVGGGTDADIAEAIRYAAGLSNASGTTPPQRAHVINMSLGGPGFSQTMQNAVTAARAAGVVVLAAAGNSSSTGFFSPAGLEGVVSVVSLNSARARAWYSNHGPAADVSAPGGDDVDRDGDGQPDSVLSTIYDDSFQPPLPLYVGYQGTSMACPHVAGVAALVLAVDPTLTPDEVEAVLFATAEDLGAPGRDDQFGHGLVNALAAVLAVGGGPPVPPLLGLEPRSFVLNEGRPSAEAWIANLGGGLLEVDAPVVETDSGGDWLSAELLGPPDATRTATGVRLVFDRFGVPFGLHVGRVTVSSNGGTAEIVVVGEVGLPAAPVPSVDLRVRAVSAVTGQLVQEVVVNSLGSLQWSFPTLPIGDYLFVAASDQDGDGSLCEDGDWCGTFPLEAQPQVVTVLAGVAVTDVSFRVLQRRTLGDTRR
jgi:serine protease